MEDDGDDDDEWSRVPLAHVADEASTVVMFPPQRDFVKVMVKQQGAGLFVPFLAKQHVIDAFLAIESGDLHKQAVHGGGEFFVDPVLSCNEVDSFLVIGCLREGLQFQLWFSPLEEGVSGFQSLAGKFIREVRAADDFEIS